MREIFVSGGVLMWPLLICSLIALTIIIEKAIYWLFLVNEKKGQNSQRGLLILETVVQIAPILGILGTILGILKSFKTLKLDSNSALDGLSASISEALITTAFGLSISVIGTVFFVFYTYKAKKLEVAI